MALPNPLSSPLCPRKPIPAVLNLKASAAGAISRRVEHPSPPQHARTAISSPDPTGTGYSRRVIVPMYAEAPRTSETVHGAQDAKDAQDESLDAAYAYCRGVAREVARTFYYGSLFLPEPKRRAAWALYAFCRTADDIADESERYPDPVGELARWREALVETYAGRPRGPVLRAWADLLTRYPVPLQPALDLLEGVERDARGVRFRTFAELRHYCYQVAGTVGLLMTPILGYREAEALPLAVELGVAMQLTNILRDIGEDARRGRVYLPDDELVAFGCSREALLRGEVTARSQAFRQVLAFQIARAEEYYERGLRGVSLLDPDGRLAIALSGRLYRAILGRIRANDYDVFARRAHISLAGKLAAVPGTWYSLRRAR